MTTYISTRGEAPELGFEDVVLTGLASDGGLYVPKTLPHITPDVLIEWSRLSYPELAFRVMQPFVGDAMPPEDLQQMAHDTYAEFRHNAVAPLVQIGHNHYILELFHGPTLAFKDFALQFLGRFLDYFLSRRGEHITIVGATSGDTGSAAIAGCRGRDNMDIFIFHPHGRVSEVQRRQMTTIADKNVHNIALSGTFDDCQDMVKALFANAAFREQQKLVAVNSINWARILAQVVYYFYAALALGAPARAVSFSVPTGNFGDIYAGYIAKQMGLPIDQLIIATNKNDILTRCLNNGEYRMQGVAPTLSPSMDIQISSNFERLLFDLYKRDSAALSTLMTDLRNTKGFALATPQWNALKRLFDSASVDDAATKATIKKLYAECEYLADPHTAVGVAAAEQCARSGSAAPVVVLSTAHPAKFPDAAELACGITPTLPPHMIGLMEAQERCTVLNAGDSERIMAFIRENQGVSV
ncbi:MAG: threonine synthase [Alphaproteobacteria bacterium]|nr:threonine synthase [Alphaproteobacteria bacterium]